LERRLGLNSSKPPRTDALHKPSPKSQRSQTGKGFGGQKDHKGKTLNHADVADETIACTISECSLCHSSLDAIFVTSVEERQEFCVVIKRHVRSYVSDVKICNCGHINRCSLPEHIKSHVQYGETAKAVNIALMNNFVPLKRLVDFNKQVLESSPSFGNNMMPS
jgi:transposase